MHQWFIKLIALNNEDDKYKNLYMLFRIAVIFFCFIIVIGLIVLFFGYSKQDANLNISTLFGTFGDFLGGSLNPIFTFLTFIGLLITITIQQTELKESREEFKKSANALIEQSQSLSRQNFENTFFNLITLYNGILDNLKLENTNKQILSRQIFASIQNNILKTDQKIPIDDFGGQVLDNIKFFYSTSKLDTYSRQFSHYFRTVYQILKFIDNSHFNQEEKQFYSNIFRAQFSGSELVILFFNCLSKYGKEKFKPLVEKYEFFEHLVIDDKFLFRDLQEYDINAFGNNIFIQDYIESMSY